jgi:urease accessory protein UreE
MTMHYALIHRRAGQWPKEKAAGTLTLDFDARHRRRIRLTEDQGEGVLLDLPKAVAMADRATGKIKATSRSRGFDDLCDCAAALD